MRLQWPSTQRPCSGWHIKRPQAKSKRQRQRAFFLVRHETVWGGLFVSVEPRLLSSLLVFVGRRLTASKWTGVSLEAKAGPQSVLSSTKAAGDLSISVRFVFPQRTG
jgi:hypothetical protein